MEKQTERQVWERVAAGSSLTAEQALLPERLAALITQEKNSAAACHQLAARLSGSDSASARRIKAQTENRVRQLNAIYYLLTGMRTSIKPTTVPFHNELCDALREECLLLLTQQEQYRKTAAEFPAYADTLEPLLSELRQNLRAVTQILQRVL